MPLYRVRFVEEQGYRCTCQIRAASCADHVALAVQKIWGAAAVWECAPGSQTLGRVVDRDYARDPEDVYRTALTTVDVQRATRQRANDSGA